MPLIQPDILKTVVSIQESIILMKDSKLSAIRRSPVTKGRRRYDSTEFNSQLAIKLMPRGGFELGHIMRISCGLTFNAN